MAVLSSSRLCGWAPTVQESGTIRGLARLGHKGPASPEIKIFSAVGTAAPQL